MSVVDGATTVATYGYDLLGRRVSKTVGGVTTTYAWAGDSIVEECDGGSCLPRRFVYAGLDQPVMMVTVDGQTETEHYYHYDALGSVIAMTDASGNIVERYEYTAFGETTIYNAAGTDITATGSAIGNPYMFTARRYDEESGLYYYRHRMYNPELGRFMQPDPIRYRGGLNLYAYVGNNPLNWTDPWGLEKHDAEEILEEGRNSPYNPLRYADYSDEGWGFGKIENRYNDTYELADGTVMSADGFGNYIAGYMGGYHMGVAGIVPMRTVGNWYENQSRKSGENFFKRNNIFFGDDPKSIRDINSGFEDGLGRRYEDIVDIFNSIYDWWW